MANPVPAQPTPLTERPGFLLSQLGFHGAQRFAERLAPLGLRPRHFGLLTHLAAAEGSSQQQLADAMAITRNAIVGIVDDLEALGLVERARHPHDRRAHALQLTSAGRAALADATRAADAHDAELLDGLDPVQRRELLALLRHVADRAGLAPGVHSLLRPGRE